MTAPNGGEVVAIVQARMGSTRLPGKVMRPIGGIPMIELLLSRLSKSKRIDRIVLATSEGPQNAPLAAHVRSLGYDVFEGSERDVLDRFYQAARRHQPRVVIRVTGDCPLLDPDVVDRVVDAYEAGDVDYASNINPPTFPDGLDVEAFSFESLERAAREATESYDREHVTPYLREPSRFRMRNITADEDHSALRWTVDEPEDFRVVSAVFEHFTPRTDFGWEEILTFQRMQPKAFSENAAMTRNAGATMGSGQKLWQRAKKVIAGGNMFLSKRPEMFLPDQWPAYYSKAKGCTVWDLDGREYIDTYLMGVGTNVLGYAHDEVDDAVMQTVRSSNMSSLNCPEEVETAERLVALHPWADMARLGRTGGEVNAIAIRIARAASGRDKVAFCGYHGWHDWYLSANLADDRGLDGHLLPGLDPLGVPRHLTGTVLPFMYNDLPALEKLLNEHPDVGVIKMEVSRNKGPNPGYLEGVRELATKHGAVLIFDECTSGFRETFGGLHKKFGVDPDMATFGKALGNGYAITAVIGRREIMESAQGSFISSTFWSERIGPSAAVATLAVMEREQSWTRITETGLGIKQRWDELATRHGITLEHWGLPALTGFTIPGERSLVYKTLITQEMLKRGYLAGNAIYVSLAHTPEILDGYFAALDPVMAMIGECEKTGRDPSTLLEGPVCHAGFKRLN